MNLNPWHIIRVPKDVSKSELKKEYQRLAKIFHPDKPKGNRKKFLVLNWAYREIKKSISAREASFTSLKTKSKDFELPEDPEVANFANKNFDVNKFNKFFDKWYQPQIKKKKVEPPPENVQFPKVIDGNVSQAYDTFVQQNVPQDENRLSALPVANLTSQINQLELGVTEIKDYTNYAGSLKMTDYAKAYTPQHIPTIEEKTINLNNTKSQRSSKITVSAEEQEKFNNNRMQVEIDRNNKAQTQRMLDQQSLERFNQMRFQLR